MISFYLVMYSTENRVYVSNLSKTDPKLKIHVLTKKILLDEKSELAGPVRTHQEMLQLTFIFRDSPLLITVLRDSLLRRLVAFAYGKSCDLGKGWTRGSVEGDALCFLRDKVQRTCQRLFFLL